MALEISSAEHPESVWNPHCITDSKVAFERRPCLAKSLWIIPSRSLRFSSAASPVTPRGHSYWDFQSRTRLFTRSQKHAKGSRCVSRKAFSDSTAIPDNDSSLRLAGGPGKRCEGPSTLRLRSVEKMDDGSYKQTAGPSTRARPTRSGSGRKGVRSTTPSRAKPARARGPGARG